VKPGFARQLAVAAMAGLAATFAAAATPFDVPQLMATLAAVERSTVAFEETRHFAVLKVPIVRRGTLKYVRPDRLEMDVVTPFPETTEIVGTRVRIETPDGRREWDLAGQPVALAWIEAIRASLAGDEATLTRLFRVSLTGSADAWQIRLEPVAPRVAAALNRIDVRGRQAQLSTIEIFDAHGDRIVIMLKTAGRGPQ